VGVVHVYGRSFCSGCCTLVTLYIFSDPIRRFLQIQRNAYDTASATAQPIAVLYWLFVGIFDTDVRAIGKYATCTAQRVFDAVTHAIGK